MEEASTAAAARYAWSLHAKGPPTMTLPQSPAHAPSASHCCLFTMLLDSGSSGASSMRRFRGHGRNSFVLRRPTLREPRPRLKQHPNETRVPFSTTPPPDTHEPSNPDPTA
eukprot:1098468-Rhodomonas_salina.1